MLIYSIATNKSVGDRINSLNSTVNKNIKGRLGKIDTDETKIDDLIKGHEAIIEKSTRDKEGATAEEIKRLDDRIERQQESIMELHKSKHATVVSRDTLAKLEKEGYTALSVAEAKHAKDMIEELFITKEREDGDIRTSEQLDIDEEDVRDETLMALDDLIKLNRRKEEAL